MPSAHTAIAAARPAALPSTLWALLFGNFVIGTGVMVVSGTLNEISNAFHVSVPQAGQLISAGALLMCVTAPLFAALVAGWDTIVSARRGR